MGGAERHFGFDFDFEVGLGTVGVERGTNPYTEAVGGSDEDGGVLFFPFFVPVDVGHGLNGELVVEG